MSADLESNSEREIRRHDFQVYVWETRATAGSFELEKSNAKRGQSDRRQESDWGSRRLCGGLVFGFFAGPDEENGRQRRRGPLHERLREKENIIAYRKSTCSKRHIAFIFFLPCRFEVLFGSWLGIQVGIMGQRALRLHI